MSVETDPFAGCMLPTRMRRTRPPMRSTSPTASARRHSSGGWSTRPSNRKVADMARAILLVMDSVGIGGAADAAAFDDEGADTIGHVAAARAAGTGDMAGLGSRPHPPPPP